MDKGEIAKEYFLSGLNCAQSVLLAFKEETGLSEDALKKLSIGFGGGIGRQRLVCGAVSGLVTVLGLTLSDGNDKAKIYAIIKDACERFKRETGSLICAEMLDGKVPLDGSTNPSERTEEYYKKRPCADVCLLAGKIADEIIKENGK